MNVTCAVHDGKVVGCNALKYTRALLYSDWLYFLRHGLKLIPGYMACPVWSPAGGYGT